MRRQSILPLLIPLFFLFLNVKFAISGQISTGQPCDLSKNVLDRATHKFSSDCNPRAYCSQNATCTSKGCRRDEYPFGYVQGEAIPPMCAVDQYCPDEEDACRPLIALGAACQLNRDDECQPPSNSTQISSICLESKCQYANLTLGQACSLDNTVYFGFTAGGQEFTNIVSRDNCITPGLFCDPYTFLCTSTKEIGEYCGDDKECKTYNCNAKSSCDYTLDTPVKVTFWIFFLTGVAILGAIGLVSGMLFMVHKRHREQRQREMQEYYRQQTNYRNSIIQMHSYARDQKPWMG